MLVRSILSSYFRLFTGALLAASAIALTGCQESTAEKVVQGRPVLVATVKYEAASPERSFVGTIRPRIETDMGFRVPGKVAKRLVEVGQTVDVGQPLALLDEVDLKLQAEQAQAEFSAATGVQAQASASEQRAKDLRAKGWTTDAQMDSARAAADEARARLNRAERQVELTKNSLSYATLVADARGVVTATLTLADPATDRVAKLPLSALYNQGGAPSLYVVDGSGSVALKPVTVKAYESDKVVIADGVEEGARVVALGVQKLDPAQKVRVVSSLSF
jgi:multidrug efflux pump subunit AcrA (membrane-fusion protein)